MMYAIRCPIHGEKTPSFTVNAESGDFHCLGCGEKGDYTRLLPLLQKSYEEAATAKVAKTAKESSRDGALLAKLAEIAARRDGRGERDMLYRG